MAIYPGANSVTLVEEGDKDGVGDQPIIIPRGVILHTNGSPATCSGMLGLMNRTSQEFHFEIEKGGRVCQFVHTDVRADNNFHGNSFTIDGRLYGYISIETSDDGTPYEKSWTDLGQRQALENLLVWICKTHNIPASRCTSPTGPGIGYHAMWGYNTVCASGSGTYGVYTAPDGRRACLNNPWTNALGKICPGPGKIREFQGLLDAVARRLAGGAPTPGDDDVVPYTLWQDPRNRKTYAVATNRSIKNWLRSVADVQFAQSLLTIYGFPPGGTPNFHATNIADTAVEQAYLDSIPDGDELAGLAKLVADGYSSQNAILQQAFAATATKAHLQEVEDKVDLIPKSPLPPGTPVSLTVELTGTATPAP